MHWSIEIISNTETIGIGLKFLLFEFISSFHNIFSIHTNDNIFCVDICLFSTTRLLFSFSFHFTLH